MALNTASTVGEVKELLLRMGISEEIAETFSRNEICGQAFLALTEGDLKELVPMIGARIKIREVIKEVIKEHKVVSILLIITVNSIAILSNFSQKTLSLDSELFSLLPLFSSLPLPLFSLPLPFFSLPPLLPPAK